MKKENIQVGQPAYTIRFDSVFPRNFIIMKGKIATNPSWDPLNKVFTVRFSDTNGFSGFLCRIGELFATEEEARDYLIIWLRAALDASIKRREIKLPHKKNKKTKTQTFEQLLFNF